MTKDGRELLEQGAKQLGVSLDQNQLLQFALLLNELQKWNRKINLTAVCDEPGIIVKHFLDSLTLVRHLPTAAKILDIGSGGGFPALPLKIVLPAAEVVSVDAVEKKILFQRQVSRLLHLERFNALHARAEHLPRTYPHAFDFIVTRAFSDLGTYVKLAVPLIRNGGTIIAMKGAHGSEEIAGAKNIIAENNIVMTRQIQLQLPHSGDGRVLVFMGYETPQES